MTMPPVVPTRSVRDAVARVAGHLTPRQRQYALLAALLGGGVGMLWLILATSESGQPAAGPKAPGTSPGPVTNLSVMPPGQQVNPVDQWVGTAGSKLAQYESEREEQGRLNRDRQAFEARTMQRFAELEQRLTNGTPPASSGATPGVPPVPSLPPPPAAATPPAWPATGSAGTVPPPIAPPPASPTTMPPASALPLPPASGYRQVPIGLPPIAGTTPLAGYAPTSPVDRTPAVPVLTRLSLVDRSASPATTDTAGPATGASANTPRTVATYLPVSFIRGTLLGGLDAPTGGQAQSNPHPVLIRLSDNAVLPNRYRGEYRDCFVVAAGYGDISAERAYLRTENLSCVRTDGATLEVRIQGTVYGEDGKVGMRGRLVTKQGQMLANALLAGVVSGIGSGLATSSSNVSTSALGTITTATGAEAYRAGVGSGVGRALDRLAQYYIKLAENTFPVIEVDAGREIDVVITKGVRIDVPMDGHAADSAAAGTPGRHERRAPLTALPTREPQEAQDDERY